MKPHSVINIVGVRATRPEQDTKLNKWYTERHIPDLMKFKGMKHATWLKTLNPEDKYPTYLLISEFNNQKDYEAYEKSAELAESRMELAQTWGDDRFEIVWRVQFKAVKNWEQ